MSIGSRLKEERSRLEFSQEAFGEVGGVRKQAQLNYEKDERSPDANYLGAIAEIGADVQYIVTGQRQGHGIGESAIHQAVLDAVDLLSLGKKVDAAQLAKAITKLVARASAPLSQAVPQRGPIATFGGSNKGVVTDSVTIHGGFNPSKK